MSGTRVVSGIRLLIFCLVVLAMVNAAAPNAAAQTGLDQAAIAAEVANATAAVSAKDDDTFFYQSAGRRDPFVPLIDQLQKTTRVVVDKPRGPLQQYELSQFRLMAVLVVKGRPMAMVKAPDGKSYPVKIGDEIGRYEGKVANIETKQTERDALGKRIEVSPDQIVVEETLRDNFTNKKTVEYRYLTM